MANTSDNRIRSATAAMIPIAHITFANTHPAAMTILLPQGIIKKYKKTTSGLPDMVIVTCYDSIVLSIVEKYLEK